MLEFIRSITKSVIILVIGFILSYFLGKFLITPLDLTNGREMFVVLFGGFVTVAYVAHRLVQRMPSGSGTSDVYASIVRLYSDVGGIVAHVVLATMIALLLSQFIVVGLLSKLF